MNSKTVRLEELCTIKTGAPTSRAKKIAEGVEPKEVKVLLPRAMQGGSIIDNELAIETVGEVKDENFTHEGDAIHVWCSKKGSPLDAGIALAHLYVSSEDAFRFFRADHVTDLPGYGYIGSVTL